MNDVPFSLFGALQALFYAVPIFVANMAPVLVRSLPFLGQPIDGGRLWKGKPILGSHKTWRGLLFGVLAAIGAIYLQAALVGVGVVAAVAVWSDFSLINYDQPHLWLLGLLMGLGAITGDAIESFFKRRIGISEGGAWPVFDQLDFIVGGLLFSSILVVPSPMLIVFLLVLTPFGHIFMNAVAYAIGLKEVPY